MAAWDPGGRLRMRAETVWKVPQVHGKSSDLRVELIKGVGVFVCGKERFWMR